MRAPCLAVGVSSSAGRSGRYSRSDNAPDNPDAQARLPEFARGNEFGDHLPWPKTRCFDIGDRVFSNLFLLVARVEDCRAVARAAIVALPVEGRRVVNLEEELQECAEAYFLGIENDLDGFGMAVVIAIGGIRVPCRPYSRRGSKSRPAACE